MELERELGWSPRRLDNVRAERPGVSLDAPYRGDEGAVRDRLGKVSGVSLVFAGVPTMSSPMPRRFFSTAETERERQVLAEWRLQLDGEGLLVTPGRAALGSVSATCWPDREARLRSSFIAHHHGG